jgi:hypothetical protein
MPKTKLSKLQKFILKEAAASLPTLERTAHLLNTAIRSLRAEAKPIEQSSLPHVTRNQILIRFFGLELKKDPLLGEDTDRIDAQRAGEVRYNCAHASFYRALKRLEVRGLIKRMARRGDLQLTQEGITLAALLNPLAASPEAQPPKTSSCGF